MTMAISTGFGQAEIASLRRDEIYLNKKHPHAEELQLTSDETDSWVMRLRGKTTVYGEWWLMQTAVTAIRWLTDHRPTSSEPFLFLTKKGSPLKTEGERNTQIANAWLRLVKRIQKDHEGFRVLSFNKLRKTASNWIRQNHGDYLAELFLSHGEPAEGEVNAYTNERWADLHAAIRKLAMWLEPVFSSVSNSFPPEERKGGANISPGKISRIIELHEAGDRVSQIAEKLDLSTETVRQWIKRHASKQAGSVD